MADTETIGVSKSPHWGVFGTLAWGASIALAFFTVQSIVAVAYLRRQMSETNLREDQVQELLRVAQDNGIMLSIATLASALVCVPMIFVIAKLKRHSRLKDYLALNPLPPRTLGIWLIITAGFIVLSDGLALALGRPVVPEFMQSAYASADPVWLIWVAFAVGAPLFEETFFRGFLFKGLAPALKSSGAVVVSAALWAAIHLQYDTFGMTTVLILGLLLGLARVRTRSLVTPWAMHALVNIVACMQAALSVN